MVIIIPSSLSNREMEVWTMNPKFMNVRDVMSELGVSKNKAYLVIRELNEELIAQGFMCVRGKVNRKYFEKKFYGFEYATDNADK